MVERKVVPVNYSLETRAVRGPRLPRVAAAIEELQEFPTQLIDDDEQERLSHVLSELHYFEGLAQKKRIAANQPPLEKVEKRVKGRVEMYRNLPIRQLTTEKSVASDSGWSVSLTSQDRNEFEPMVAQRQLQYSNYSSIQRFFREEEWQSIGFTVKKLSTNHPFHLDTNISPTFNGREPLLVVRNKKVSVGVYRFQDVDEQTGTWVPQMIEYSLNVSDVEARRYIELGLSDDKKVFLYREMKFKE